MFVSSVAGQDLVLLERHKRYKRSPLTRAAPCKTGEAVLWAGTSPAMLTGPEPASSSHQSRLSSFPLLILCFGCSIQSLKWKNCLTPPPPRFTYEH